jgi:hypothetical protein
LGPAFNTLIFALLDLCFWFQSRGLAKVFSPYASGFAIAGVSPDQDFSIGQRLGPGAFQQRWHAQLLACDSYHNGQLFR